MYSKIIPIGTFANALKNILKARWLRELEGLGLVIAKQSDNVYSFVYKGVEIFKGTKAEAEAALKEYFENSKKGGLERYLDEVKRVREILDDFVIYRNKYIGKSADELKALFKGVFNPKHFKLEDLKDFYYTFKRKYPMLTQGKHNNFAEFRNIFKVKGKTIRDFRELSHSGRDKLYDHFLDTITDSKFLKNVRDSLGYPKNNDSEIKWIYNFLKNHLHTADEFIIETKNIFYACSSCQREFLILQEYVAKKGKKMKITIYGDETIEGTADLLDMIKK